MVTGHTVPFPEIVEVEIFDNDKLCNLFLLGDEVTCKTDKFYFSRCPNSSYNSRSRIFKMLAINVDPTEAFCLQKL